MKRPLLTFLPLSVMLAACAGTPVGVTTPSAAAVAAPAAPSPAVASTADTARAPTPPAASVESLDPLAVGADLEAASVPTVVQTPAKELRAKSRADLAAALALVQNETTLEAAAKKVTTRLGKPTWVENGTKRVWIAKDGSSCHRFVLENDGRVELESAPVSEWRTLTAVVRQSACTGEIKRGGLSD